MKTNFFVWFVILALLLVLPSTVIASGCLARGAVPGELYVYGIGGTFPAWWYWLYRSTDYGQTVYYQSDTQVAGEISEGVDTGGLYKTLYGDLYYSDNFGVDFILKNDLGSGLSAITSGFSEGEVYAHISLTKYSDDYGETFVNHGNCPGLVNCMSVGHIPGEVYCGCEFGEIYYSNDYGVTYGLIVDMVGVDIENISRGSENSEIYFLGDRAILYYSPNGGDSVYQQYFFGDVVESLAGGFSPGEVYVADFWEDMSGRGDLYIYRSIDYGQTFVTYHVYSRQEDVLIPEKVTDMESSVADSSIVLTWSDINQDIWGNPEEIDYYVVYRSIDPNFLPTTEDSIGAPTESLYTDSESDSLARCFYVVTAIDDSGNTSKASNKLGNTNKALVNE